MKILFTIAHFYRPDPRSIHASEHATAQHRAAAVSACLGSLRQQFGPRSGLLHAPTRTVRIANEDTSSQVDVVICTAGVDHLLSLVPAGLFRHHPTHAQPRLLGYECHAVLRDSIGQYDWYAYLEDDILLHDPLFFQKLTWFNKLAGDDAVLQPNRYERAIGAAFDKLYIDGNIVDPTVSPRFQNTTEQRLLESTVLGRPVRFQRIENPHSGCFFLNDAQMRHWAAQPYYLDRSADFWGPLESAATLGVMRSFRVYKPSRENAAFLEVEHSQPVYLGRRLRIENKPPYRW